MKNIRFKYVFLLMFALLFANLLSINLTKVKAEETIDLDKAYRGEFEDYWALVNYGDNMVGSDVVTIFLDPEAIANENINYILINEVNSHGVVETTYYQRGVHSQFASRFTYRFIESGYGKKPIVIHLMSSLEDSYAECVEKIIVSDLERVKTIEGLTANDFYIEQEITEMTSSPYRLYVGIKNNPQDYRLKDVVYSYSHKNEDGSTSIVSGNAIVYDEIRNIYYFTISENSIYDLVVSDRFGNKVEGISIKIENFYGNVISIVASYDTSFTRERVLVNIEVYEGVGHKYPSNLIEYIKVSKQDGTIVAENIKNIGSFYALDNGVYIVDCLTTSGTTSTLEVNITNIDREAPIIVVPSTIRIKSSEVEKRPYVFDPEAYLIATDNASNGDDLRVIVNYYYPASGGVCDIDRIRPLDVDVYRYLYGVNDVCITYEVVDEAYNSRSVITKIEVSDNTKPTISYTRLDLTLQIGDDIPTNEELISYFGLEVDDNSRLFNPNRELTIDTDLSGLNLEELGVYNIFIHAVDESGNEGIPVKFIVTVTVRRLFIEAVPNQYIVYGEPMRPILYTCNGNACQDEILPKDFNKLVGELYISSGAQYAGTYDISSSLAINSEKYKIELGSLGKFTIKQRTFKIIANSYSIYYKDEEPILTWYMDTSVCQNGKTNYSGNIDAIDYSCTFVNGDRFGGGVVEYEVINGIQYYRGAIQREVGNTVKFDADKNVTYYKIHIGDLSVLEVNSGGKQNYHLDFYGLYGEPARLYKDYARFYIYPKYVEVSIHDVNKVYGESDPRIIYDSNKVDAKREDRISNYQYEFRCEVFDNKHPLNGVSTGECQQEINLVLSRDEGETVGRYKIKGKALNENYDVRINEEFEVSPIASAYLNIVKRSITIAVDGDPKGSKKYVIIYEDDLPNVTVSVSNDPSKTYQGLATGFYTSINDNTNIITFTDRLVLGENPIKYLKQDGSPIGDYVPGAGKYIIDMNEITIKDDSDTETLSNYDLNFDVGELEVIQRHIYIKIIDGLTKVYGDSDPSFASYQVPNDTNYVVDGNKRFLLQIYDTFQNNDIIDEDDYEPLDKNLLKYYMVRNNIRRGQSEVDVHDGEMVGEYLVKCEKFENASNYVIGIYQDYYFTITRRTMKVHINDGQIEFNYNNDLPKIGYSYENAAFSDTLVGQPKVSDFAGEYRNNGEYSIGMGNIIALSSRPIISRVGDDWYINGNKTNITLSMISDLDLTLIEVNNGKYYIVDIANKTRLDTGVEISEVNVMWNYSFDIEEGTLKVIPRNVVIVPEDGRSKVYGDYDPRIRYSVKHYVDGVVIQDVEAILDSSDFRGSLGRESGEKPGEYEIVQGGLLPALKGSGYNFRIVSVEGGHKFTINKRDLTLRLAAGSWDSDEEVFKVTLAYGDSLDILASGYIYVNGTDEAGPSDLCTLEMINGVETCHKIYDTVVGSYGIRGNIVPEDVGRYTITKGDLRIVRVINPEIDVSAYYNFVFIESILEIVPREIIITPHNGQSKIYGENDRTDSVVVEGCGIGFDYSPVQFVKSTDKFVGCLQRLSKINIKGEPTTEDVGDYQIGIGTLDINDNYRLILNGSVMYRINPRTLIVTAVVEGPSVRLGAEDHSYTMQYEEYDPSNPPFRIKYVESGMGRANNASLNIKDEIINNVWLSRYDAELKDYVSGDAEYVYIGVEDYTVIQGLLYVTNARNYTFQFNEAKFKVTKKVVTIKPYPMSKIYDGDESNNPVYLYEAIGTNLPTPTGALTRVRGEAANRYQILQGDLYFGENYIIDMDTYKEFFTIHPREVTIKAKDAIKIYNPYTPDPIFEYEVVEVQGNFVLDEPLLGALTREGTSQEVGKYKILQGEVRFASNNYKIIYEPGIYEIRYVEVTDVFVKLLSGDRYQLDKEETPVSFYAQFNEGANPEYLSNVTWKITKSGGFDIPFSKDTNNIITFTPSGTGTYKITATYNGITGEDYIYVNTNNVSQIFISLTSGYASQILGAETLVKYTAKIHLYEQIDEEITVEWFADDIVVCTNTTKSDTDSCSFVPNMLGIGTHAVYAKISSTKSASLELIIKDNEIPRIIFENQNRTYFIESHLNHTEDSIFFDAGGYSAIDDIDGDITKFVKIKGLEQIDYNKVGTYYVVYEVEDSHGHIATNYRTIVIRDTVAPVLKLERPEYTNIVLQYGEEYGDYGDAIANDLYDDHYGINLVIRIESNLDLNKIGDYTISYVAIDSNGNRGSVSRYVTIKDTIPPVITLNGNKDVTIEYKGIYREYGAEFSDNYDKKHTIYPSTITFIPEGGYEEDGIEVASVDTGVLGTYRLVYYKLDSSGNAPLEFPVRNVYVVDTTAPEIILKGSNPYYLVYGFEYVDPGYEAIDNYDEYVEVSVREVIGNTLGTYYVYYDAIDSHNNKASQVIRTVILIDIVSPTLDFTNRCPQYMEIEAIHGTYPIECDMVDIGFTVTDDYLPDIDAIKNWVVITRDIDLNTVGEYTVTYYVEDSSHNRATLIRYISVIDSTPPVITLNPHETFETIDFYLEVFGEYKEPGWVVYDEYDEFHKDEGLETRVEYFTDLNVNKLNTYTIEYIAIDSNGNESEPVYRNITVRDAIPPVVTLIGDQRIVIERGGSYPEYNATAIDNYDGVIDISEKSETPTGKEIGLFEVHYCAVDSSGNKGCATREVLVQDTIPPTVLGVEDGAYYRTPVSIFYSPLTGTDEVLTGTLNGELIANEWYVYQEGKYHLVVSDDAGNKTTIDFTIDRTPPKLLGVNNGEYVNYPVTIYAEEELSLIAYRLNNGGYVTTTEQTVYLSLEGKYWVYAIDIAGNISETITFVVDTTPPKYNLLGVLNEGITNTDVILNTENDVIVSVNNKAIPTSYTFSENGYYQITIRDLAGNDVFLQFTINKEETVQISNQNVKFISQNNAIDKFVAKGDPTYPKSSGFIYAMPLLEGGYKYISGTLFSDEEYSKLLAGEDVVFDVPQTDEDQMIVAFIVTLDELNKFTTQTVEGDEDSTIIYAIVAVVIAALMGGSFYFFVVAKRKHTQEEDEEIIEDEDYDPYY